MRTLYQVLTNCYHAETSLLLDRARDGTESTTWLVATFTV